RNRCMTELREIPLLRGKFASGLVISPETRYLSILRARFMIHWQGIWQRNFPRSAGEFRSPKRHCQPIATPGVGRPRTPIVTPNITPNFGAEMARLHFHPGSASLARPSLQDPG